MYHNNISERSSSRVLQQPGGRQTYNIFGGGDDAEPQQRKGRGAVNNQNASQQSNQEPVAKAPLTSHTSSIGAVFQEDQNVAQPAAGSAPAPAQVQAPFAQDDETQQNQPKQTPRSVNNIWGSDDDSSSKPSTRVTNKPGGSSSGVAGALGGSEAPVQNTRAGGANRANQTSANSPFSSQPEPVRSSTRVHQAPGGQSSNILSWQ